MKKVNLWAITLIAVAVFNRQADAQTSTAEKNRQNKIVYSAGISGAIGGGSFNETHKWGLGGAIQADFPVTEKLYVIANVGFDNFFGREITMNNNTRYSVPDARFLPVTAGLKYFAAGKFYVQGAAGVSFPLNKDKLNYDRTLTFVYSPQIGVRLPLTDNNDLDVGASYERSTAFAKNVKDSKIDFYALKLAYTFSL